MPIIGLIKTDKITMKKNSTIVMIFFSSGLLNASPVIPYPVVESCSKLQTSAVNLRQIELEKTEIQLVYDYYIWIVEAALTGKYPYCTRMEQSYISRIKSEKYSTTQTIALHRKKLPKLPFSISPHIQHIFSELHDKINQLNPWQNTLHEKEEINTLLKQIKQAHHLEEPTLLPMDTIAINQEKCVYFMIFLDAMIDVQSPKDINPNKSHMRAQIFLHFLPAFEPVSTDFRKAVTQLGQNDIEAWRTYLMQVDSGMKEPWFPHSQLLEQWFYMLVKDWCTSSETTVNTAGVDHLFEYMNWNNINYQDVLEYIKSQLK